MPPERRKPSERRRFDLTGYAWALVISAAVTGVGWVLFHPMHLAGENVLMLYLVGVLWVATHHSRGAAILASVLSVAAFDFCFVPPQWTFAVTDAPRLTPSPLVPGGYFVGDYMGVAPIAADRFGAVFVSASGASADPTNVFYRGAP